MFEILAERLEGVFKKLGGQGRITERSIEQALREVRLALLEADVNLDVVAQFIAGLTKRGAPLQVRSAFILLALIGGAAAGARSRSRR